MNKKVLYISYDGLTDPLGQSQVLPYLQGLTQKGFEFTILSFEKKERLASEGDLIRSITQKSGINWVPMSFTKNPPVVSKIYDRIRMFRKAEELHRKFRFDMIHCRSYVSAEVGIKLKKVYGVKFLFDMRGFWADEKVDNGQWNTGKYFYRKLYSHYKKKERQFLINADGIISLTQAASDYLKNQPLYNQLPIDVIPCCADLQHFDYNKISAAQKDAVRKSLDIDAGRRVMVYLGSIGGWYMIKEMFDFFRMLSEKHPEYLLLVLTKDDASHVIEEAKKSGLSEDQIRVRYSTREQLPSYLEISETSIYFINACFSKIASSPTKHAELMGMGIPIICNDIGDTGRIISKTETGYIVPSFNETEYRNAINLLPQVTGIQKDKIRSSALEFFDLKNGVEMYASAYNRILNQ